MSVRPSSLRLLVALAVTLAAYTAAPTPALAVGFIPPISGLDGTTETYAILNDGSKVVGQVKMSMLMNGKLKAADIKELGNKVSDLQRAVLMVSEASTLSSLVNADFNEIIHREYSLFRQARMSAKKARFSLLQLLNPGFDSRIQVFLDPDADEDSGALFSSGLDRSYLVVKDGGAVFKVKKGARYKRKDFPAMFGDCEQLMSHPDLDKIKFKGFPEHVFLYDQLCGAKAAAE